MATKLTDRTIEREPIVVPSAAEKKARKPRTQTWVWHNGFAHRVFRGPDAYDEAVAYRKAEKQGKGDIDRVTRQTNIPPAALVASWEAVGHAGGTKADVARKFGLGSFNPSKLKDYAAEAYTAVNGALRKKGKDTFDAMAKLPNGGTKRGMEVTGDLDPDALNEEIELADEDSDILGDDAE